MSKTPAQEPDFTSQQGFPGAHELMQDRVLEDSCEHCQHGDHDGCEVQEWLADREAIFDPSSDRWAQDFGVADPRPYCRCFSTQHGYARK